MTQGPKFDIDEKYGGNTPENIAKMEKKLAEIGPLNAHLEPMELNRICEDLIFGSPETGQRTGGF